MSLARQKQRLARLVRIRDRQRDLAAAAVAADRQSHTDALYEHDLAVRAIADLPPGSEIAPWELERLGQVVDQTHDRIESSARRLVASQKALREASLSLERAYVLHERVKVALVAHIDKVEQREADDRYRPRGLQ